ncbi:hypothetical protein [Chondrinema litorale]|uniref:hypothetical protein n=1 Tax=Chondrinema litorale TaxID=2994555 RepID=UPI0025428560|nr:hypothetical protein [Chondrinema litorale]UZR99897.1 hypothetical protein OQ292_39010 [Chondrinema litorale]
MKKLLNIIFTICILNSAFAQEKILSKYDFNSGNYSLVFEDVKVREIETSLKETIIFDNDTIDLAIEDDLLLNPIKKDFIFNHFIIKDIDTLNQLQMQLTGFRENAINLCGYDYLIYILEDQKNVAELHLNIECKNIVTPWGTFDFEIYPYHLIKGEQITSRELEQILSIK